MLCDVPCLSRRGLLEQCRVRMSSLVLSFSCDELVRPGSVVTRGLASGKEQMIFLV